MSEEDVLSDDYVYFDVDAAAEAIEGRSALLRADLKVRPRTRTCAPHTRTNHANHPPSEPQPVHLLVLPKRGGLA